VRKGRLSREVDEEFAFHVEMRLREFLLEGMTLEEARRAAIERFGEIEEVKAICRKLGYQTERKRVRQLWWSELLQDIRFAVRQVRTSPATALAAVATLALGIGANTAVFSVVDGVLLSPLPFAEPERLVEIRTRYLPPSGFDLDRFEISVPELADYRESTRLFEIVGLYTTGSRTLTGSEADPERIPTVWLDRAALEALGVQPRIGRWFSADEDRPGVSIGLIGYDLWVNRFGADPLIVGRTITASGNPFTVTGVMPEGFAFPSAHYQVFENYGVDPANLGNRASHGSVGIGRLRPGVDLAQVRAESEVIHAGWEQLYAHNVAHFPIFERLQDNLVGTDVRRALTLLMVAVGIVLLIATVNVANLLLARGEHRQHEVALRTALGASRGRIVRQLLTESLTLSVLGGIMGVALGMAALRAVLRIDPGALPRSELIQLDGSVLLYTATVTIVVAILFGLAPALQAVRAPATGLGTTRRTTGARGLRLFRRGLVASEVALGLIVVVTAALVAKSLWQLRSVDPGIELEGRLVFSVAATGPRYGGSGMTDDERATVLNLFWDELQARLEAIPGVTSAAATSFLPLTGTQSRNDFMIEGRERPSNGEPMWSAQWTAVLPGYFETMGIEPTAGRLLQVTDATGAEPVVIISERAAEAYFGGQDPIGARIGFDGDSIHWARIVGVVPITRTDNLSAEVVPQVYFTQRQGADIAWVTSQMYVAMRTATEPSGLVAPARAVLQELDPTLPMTNVATMEDVADRSVAQSVFATRLLGSFALIALLLAVVGIYGLVSHSVSRRTREIGIRMALGAERVMVSRLMIREAALPALLGLGVGLLSTLAVGRMVAGLLYELSPRDPAVLGTVTIALFAIALLSSWLPARRAARMEPTEALRMD
jgi:predicted permease